MYPGRTEKLQEGWCEMKRDRDYTYDLPSRKEMGRMAGLWRKLPLALEPLDDFIYIYSSPDACSYAEGELEFSINDI
jgi:hypothetical protein